MCPLPLPSRPSTPARRSSTTDRLLKKVLPTSRAGKRSGPDTGSGGSGKALLFPARRDQAATWPPPPPPRKVSACPGGRGAPAARRAGADRGLWAPGPETRNSAHGRGDGLGHGSRSSNSFALWRQEQAMSGSFRSLPGRSLQNIAIRLMSKPQIISGTGATASAMVPAIAQGRNRRLSPATNRMLPPPPISALPGRFTAIAISA